MKSPLLGPDGNPIMNKPEGLDKFRAPFRRVWQLIKDNPLALFTFLLAIGTFLLAYTGFSQLGYLRKAQNISKTAADAAIKSANAAQKTLIATERPWLSVKAVIASDLAFGPGNKLSGHYPEPYVYCVNTDIPSSDPKTDARIVIAFKLKNIGNTPAVCICVSAAIAPDGPFLTDIPKVEAYLALRGRADTNSGYLLFPGQGMTYYTNLPIPTHNLRMRNGLKVDFLDPWLICSVNYKCAYDGSFHRTAFIADISEYRPKHTNAYWSIPIHSGRVPRKMLWLHLESQFAD